MKKPTTLDQITVENLQKIEPSVRDVKIEIGEDYAGDPALFTHPCRSNTVDRVDWSAAA